MSWRSLTGRGDAAVDRAAAAALLVLGLVEAALAPTTTARVGPQALLTLVWTVPLVWRRRWPVPVLALVVAAGPTLALVNEEGGVISYVLAAILAAFTVGRHLDRPATWWGPILCVGVNWAIYAATDGTLSDYVFTALLYGSAWGVGYSLRQRAQRISELSQESAELRLHQAERERQVLASERARIARELHDIVSHSISVITIQTQAVRRRLGAEHAAEVADLRMIEETARQAMAEMRRLLGVLRADGEPASLTPQPGLDQLARLVAETRAAGVAVEVRTEGQPVPLSPGVDLAAYRIVQEALTNCRKHAGLAPAVVLLRYSDDTLEVCVEDQGGWAPPATDGNGHGLVGMRERVALYGGTLEVGPRPGGGFAVRARIPRRQGAAE